jgi:F0F1-type ATP synthase membrane subunit c/vacuolar-type H+-ATPase subunit K
MERNLSLVIIFAFCILGPCAVFAASAFASITSLGRNPSAAPKIFIAMIVAMAFAEAVAFIAMIIVFQMFD